MLGNARIEADHGLNCGPTIWHFLLHTLVE